MLNGYCFIYKDMIFFKGDACNNILLHVHYGKKILEHVSQQNEFVCFSDLEEEIPPSKSRTAPGPIRVQSSPVRNPGLSTSPARGGPVIVQPKGQKVAELSRTIEMQLAVSTLI